MWVRQFPGQPVDAPKTFRPVDESGRRVVGRPGEGCDEIIALKGSREERRLATAGTLAAEMLMRSGISHASNSISGSC